MFKEMFGKKKENVAPATEKGSVSTTQPLDVTSSGKKEKPFRGGGEVAEVLQLDEQTFVGSEERQKNAEESAAKYGRPDTLISLHQAELSTEYPDSKGEISAKREFVYVKTPDGRVHSTKAVFERVKMDKGDKEKKIVEERSISPDGLVRSNTRTVEKSDGTTEVGFERLAYDKDGKVTAREYSLSINGKEVFRTEETPDADNAENTVARVILEKRNGREGDVGKQYESTGTGKSFRNGFDSKNTKLLEK